MKHQRTDLQFSWPRGYKTWVQSQAQNKAQWLAACVRKQPIIVLYFESENELKFYNLEARFELSLTLWPDQSFNVQF